MTTQEARDVLREMAEGKSFCAEIDVWTYVMSDGEEVEAATFAVSVVGTHCQRGTGKSWEEALSNLRAEMAYGNCMPVTAVADVMADIDAGVLS